MSTSPSARLRPERSRFIETKRWVIENKYCIGSILALIVLVALILFTIWWCNHLLKNKVEKTATLVTAHTTAEEMKTREYLSRIAEDIQRRNEADSELLSATPDAIVQRLKAELGGKIDRLNEEVRLLSEPVAPPEIRKNYDALAEQSTTLALEYERAKSLATQDEALSALHEELETKKGVLTQLTDTKTNLDVLGATQTSLALENEKLVPLRNEIEFLEQKIRGLKGERERVAGDQPPRPLAVVEEAIRKNDNDMRTLEKHFKSTPDILLAITASLEESKERLAALEANDEASYRINERQSQELQALAQTIETEAKRYVSPELPTNPPSNLREEITLEDFEERDSPTFTSLDEVTRTAPRIDQMIHVSLQDSAGKMNESISYPAYTCWVREPGINTSIPYLVVYDTKNDRIVPLILTDLRHKGIRAFYAFR